MDNCSTEMNGSSSEMVDMNMNERNIKSRNTKIGRKFRRRGVQNTAIDCTLRKQYGTFTKRNIPKKRLDKNCRKVAAQRRCKRLLHPSGLKKITKMDKSKRCIPLRRMKERERKKRGIITEKFKRTKKKVKDSNSQ